MLSVLLDRVKQGTFFLNSACMNNKLKTTNKTTNNNNNKHIILKRINWDKFATALDALLVRELTLASSSDIPITILNEIASERRAQEDVEAKSKTKTIIENLQVYYYIHLVLSIHLLTFTNTYTYIYPYLSLIILTSDVTHSLVTVNQ